MDSGYSSSIDLNSTTIDSGELDTGGIFGTGVSFGRFAGFVAFGVGLPSSTPLFFMILFTMWQSSVTIFIIGWVLSSIWNG